VFRDITACNSNTGVFTANTRIRYDKAKIIAEFGERTPTPANSPKKFKLLVMVLTPTALTETDWTMYDNQVEQFARPSSDGTALYNFWEATGGRATLEVGNLNASVGINEVTTRLLNNLEVYPNPVKNQLTLTFEATGNMNLAFELNDNMGRIIHLQELRIKNGLNTFSPALPSLSTGVYFMRLHNENINITKRVMISN
jgi:hypothetical protein